MDPAGLLASIPDRTVASDIWVGATELRANVQTFRKRRTTANIQWSDRIAGTKFLIL